MSERILLTGACGFVGSAVAAILPTAPGILHLAADGWEGRIHAADLEGVILIHLAARVHGPMGHDPGAFTRDNEEKTRRLACEAARRGARRLVLLSTVKVHGEESPGRPFTARDTPDPRDAYARSKLGAERAVREACLGSALEYAIVRSPIVFGSQVKGNLEPLLRLADSPWPLPLGALANRRSFVHADDLARLVVACAVRPQAAGRTYLAAHSEPFSTASLIAGLRRALGRPRRLWRCPGGVLELAAAAVGRSEQMLRLTRSLEVDASPARGELGWTAAIGLEAAIESMARGWGETRR